ncbi:SCO3374 family protein [Streptomyces sp. CA-106131]|uniref:SCO3374 family protein n=1 Tax=Streptomyces sp. CA-106131 TaxID=3240045 RepID=UPI003D8DF710
MARPSPDRHLSSGRSAPPPPVAMPPPGTAPGASGAVRHWYERELGWETLPGEPVRLVTGVRFDVLEVPAEAGFAALRHLGPSSPVALCGRRMRLLVAAGSAEEVPGLLDWLEWGAVALDLMATGEGGHIEAPLPPGRPLAKVPSDPDGIPESRPLPLDRNDSQGAAVWLRPPEPGCDVELLLPALSAVRGGGGAPDLVRLVDTMATQCHQVRLRSASAQPFAFS